MNIIEITSLNKSYQTGQGVLFEALKNITLKVKKGEFVAIVGPSGSGKSTLMHIIGLLDQATSGEYKLEGQNVTTFSEDQLSHLRNQKIGFVFQSFNLLKRTSALQNVVLPLIYSGIDSKHREQKAREMLGKLGLEDKTNSHPNQLSGGQQQRVAIARALVTDPAIILADEPTGNLDSKTGDEVMKIFKNLNKEGKTIVLITHSLEVAREADRMIKIKDGEIEDGH